jgi:hypothetical protein
VDNSAFSGDKSGFPWITLLKVGNSLGNNHDITNDFFVDKL